jgi:hypothetical protein
MKLRLALIAATSVVPDPAQQSRMTAPGSV